MDMLSTKCNFDYISVIQSCGIQDVNIKKGFEEKCDASAKLEEQVNNLKLLIKKKDEKTEKLDKLKCESDRYLQKLNKSYTKISTLNKEQKTLQEEILQLHLEWQEKSNDFVTKMAKMDTELKELYSQFEGETLTNILSDLNTELLQTQDIEAHLQNEYELLKQLPNTWKQYERPTALKTIINDGPDCSNLEEIKKKILLKKKNIEFLTAENNKQMKLLEKFA